MFTMLSTYQICPHIRSEYADMLAFLVTMNMQIYLD